VICASVYLLVFIRNILVHLAEKILLPQPLTFRGDYHLAVSCDRTPGDKLGASEPKMALNASWKSPVEMPFR